MKNEGEKFNYTYSAKQQEEIKNIRNKYLPQEEDKMNQLQKLDNGATQKATMMSILVGVVGTLLLGIGMCCTMVWQEDLFLPGIIVGILGIGVVATSYPLFYYRLKKEREKIAPDILRLADELLKSNLHHINIQIPQKLI